MQNLTIIIPAYNEDKGIWETVEKVIEEVPDTKILAVDDCSKDKTAEILKELKKEHKNPEFISHNENKGYGAALITGFLKADTDYITFLDADLTYHPKYIPQLMDLVQKTDWTAHGVTVSEVAKTRWPPQGKSGTGCSVCYFSW